MDFNDTPKEAAFRAEARGWLEANAEPLAPGERQELFAERADRLAEARAWQARKADAGWACITWPREYGGRDATPIESVIWNQEESKFRVPPNVFTIGLGMAGPTLMTHGTPEQKRRWLPKLRRGDEVWCQLFSEPSAGSDLANLRTQSVRDGDQWRVNGQKIWTSGAHYSDWGILVTRSDPNVPKHAGLTYFVVNMHSPGIEIRPIRQINGASGFNEVFFTDVRIPDDQRLSEVGNGWAVAITTLMNERAAIGGGDRAGFAELVKLAKQTGSFDNPAVRQKLADFYIRAKGLEYTGYRALTALSKGQTPGPENSIGKLVGAPLRQQQAELGMEMLAEAGMTLDRRYVDPTWQQAYLGAPGGRIAGGTDEIMRNIIAERVLRLPAEPRLDKNVAFRDVPTGAKA
jgi:acyl-CoA dehydrogenase